MEKKKKRPAGKILAGAAGIVLLGIIVINLILTVKAYTVPERPAGLFGIMPVIMTTDSMAPAIRNEDLLLIGACGEDEIAPGDIILFRDPQDADGGLLTHRVLEVTDAGFMTGSDADGSADTLPVPYEKVFGKYRGKVPFLGSLVLFLKTVPGMILSFVLAAAGIALYEILTRRKEKDADPKRVIDKRRVRSV